MQKKLTTILISIIFTFSLISCNKFSDKNTFLIPKGEEIIQLRATSMLHRILSEKYEFNSDTYSSYKFIDNLYSIQNNPDSDNNYNYVLKESDFRTIVKGNEIIANSLNYDLFNKFKTATEKRNIEEPLDLLLIYLAENYYKNIDFTEYKSLMARSSDISYLKEEEIEKYKDYAIKSNEELNKIEKDNLFNIEIKAFNTKELKAIAPYLEIYKNLYKLNKINSSFKKEMDVLSNEVLDPNSTYYSDIDHMINTSSKILSDYNSNLKKLQGFDSVIESILKLYIPDDVVNEATIKETAQKILKGEVDLYEYIKSTANLSLHSSIEGPVQIGIYIMTLFDSSIENRALALQFSIDYIIGTTYFNNIISNPMAEENKVDFINKINETFNTNSNGNIIDASPKVLHEISELSSALKAEPY